MDNLLDNHKRNYWAMAFEGSFFMGGIALISASGTVALFLEYKTGSVALVGLAATIQTLSMLIGQLCIAPYVRTIMKMPEFLYKNMLVQRIIPFIMAAPLIFGFGGYWPVVIFMALYAIFWFYDGFLTIPWGELSARALKLELRAHMMGMQITIGGIMSLVTGLLLAWLLATPLLTDDGRFAAIFALASVVLLPSIIAMRLVRDPSPIEKPEKTNPMQYYVHIPSVVKRNKLLQRALIARLPAYVGFSTITFIIVFGVKILDLSGAQASWLVYANIVGGLIGGISLAEVSRRLGNKITIIVCNAGVFITMCMAISLAVTPGLGYFWLFATCVLGSVSMGNWVGYFNYYLDIAPREERSVFQVIGMCIGIPFSFMGFVMGNIIDNWGYLAVFMIGGVCSATAAILSLFLKSKKFIRALHDASA